jgi:hypothetical protein
MGAADGSSLGAAAGVVLARRSRGGGRCATKPPTPWRTDANPIHARRNAARIWATPSSTSCRHAASMLCDDAVPRLLGSGSRNRQQPEPDEVNLDPIPIAMLSCGWAAPRRTPASLGGAKLMREPGRSRTGRTGGHGPRWRCPRHWPPCVFEPGDDLLDSCPRPRPNRSASA